MEFLKRANLPSGLPVLEVQHPRCTGALALQGAQVLQWQPAGHAPVLWQTRKAHTQRGRSVRGGIPICWPWFGPAMTGQAAHGFARGLDWTLRQATSDAEGVHLGLVLHSDAQTQALWNHAFELTLELHFGAALELALTTHNPGSAPLQMTQALHSYFACGDVTQTEVRGLEDTPYVDKTCAGALRTQEGPVRFTGETDRVFEPTNSTCHIHDPVLQRCTAIEKWGSGSTVVWNPWNDKAAALGDMEPEEFRQMLCVETANAGADVVHLAPGAHHTLGLRISVERR